MPRTPKGAPPTYRFHSSGQARVTVRDQRGDRRDLMLGVWQSPESRVEYQRVLAILKAHNGHYPFPDQPADAEGLTVDEVLLAWWTDAEKRYGAASLELENYKGALRPLRQLFGSHPAAQFTPKCFKAVRQRMAEARQYQVRQLDREGAGAPWVGEDRVRPDEGLACPRGKEWVKVEVLGSRQALSRKVINRHMTRIRSVFSWAVEEELVPGTVAAALRAVKGIQSGEKHVKENCPRPPAFWEDVEKVYPLCPRPVATMLRLQWLTGMRSGEVRIMRTLDLDRTDPACWIYRPGSDAGAYGRHKNAWRGQTRVVQLGPQCIELLTPWLREDEPGAYLFSPKQSVAELHKEQRANRKTPLTPSQKARKPKANPKRAPRDCYSKVSYPQSVKRACARAGIRFNPYALRHGRKMDLARTVGSDAARAVLGQKSIDSTEHYGEVDQGHARQVMKKFG